MYPAADDTAAHLARKALRFHTRLDTAESGPIKIDHRIDVIGGADAFRQWIRHQQANDGPAEEDHLVAKFVQCIRNHQQRRHVRIIRPHRQAPVTA